MCCGCFLTQASGACLGNAEYVAASPRRCRFFKTGLRAWALEPILIDPQQTRHTYRMCTTQPTKPTPFAASAVVGGRGKPRPAVSSFSERGEPPSPGLRETTMYTTCTSTTPTPVHPARQGPRQRRRQRRRPRSLPRACAFSSPHRAEGSECYPDRCGEDLPRRRRTSSTTTMTRASRRRPALQRQGWSATSASWSPEMTPRHFEQARRHRLRYRCRTRGARRGASA